jgi:hypothetical protein
MPKEKNYNPVQAQRKADKAKAIKKGMATIISTISVTISSTANCSPLLLGKADVQSKRNERLAKRNPATLQKQIDDLKAISSGGGKLTRHEEQVLEGLEKEIRAVNKARETLGDKAPTFRSGFRNDRGPDGVLGKRRRDADEGSSEDEDVPEDVKGIPMPRDTPPPIPKEVLDKWYAKRRARRSAQFGGQHNEDSTVRSKLEAPPPEVKTVYEAKPIIRDLRKEAVTAFVPAAVRTKIDKVKGQGGLMEPEEADKLEKEGYLSLSSAADQSQSSGPRKVVIEDADEDD